MLFSQRCWRTYKTFICFSGWSQLCGSLHLHRTLKYFCVQVIDSFLMDLKVALSVVIVFANFLSIMQLTIPSSSLRHHTNAVPRSADIAANRRILRSAASRQDRLVMEFSVLIGSSVRGYQKFGFSLLLH